MKKAVIMLACIVAGLYSIAQVKIGQMAPEISLPDSSGNSRCLSSLKGKVVLLDFWASWCHPCRLYNPYNAKLYDRYKDKGFEIFAVSIDNRRQSWISAIQKDQLKYTLVNDTAGWRSKVTQRYNVHEIPATILIDKTGKVVAMNLSVDALEEKIKKML